MTPATPATDFRCSVASADAGEDLAGTAPTDRAWVCVEVPGPWAAKATKDVAPLVTLPGRLQLVRRHGRPPGAGAGGGVRVFTASPPAGVRTAVVPRLEDLADLTDADLAPYDGALWLVCTHGRRDLCCAELGRPVAAALAERWPEETWETTHLGGHRFAGTLLALPSGITLGRVDPATAVAACTELERGRVPLEVTRGRSGWPAAAQYADLHVRRTDGWRGLGDVRLVGVADGTVDLDTPDGPRRVTVASAPGTPRAQSCADGGPVEGGGKVKPAPVWTVVDDRREPSRPG